MIRHFRDIDLIEVDLDQLCVRRGGHRIPLTSQVAAVIEVLLERTGEVVSAAELLERAWPDVHVDENAVRRCIVLARRALGQSESSPPIIETVRGKGYRFVPEIWDPRAHAPMGPPILLVPPATVRDNNLTIHHHAAEDLRSRLSDLLCRSGEWNVIEDDGSARHDLPNGDAHLSVPISLESVGTRTRIRSRIMDTRTGSVLWSTWMEVATDRLMRCMPETVLRLASRLRPRLLESIGRRAIGTDDAPGVRYTFAVSRYYIRGMEPADVKGVKSLLDQVLRVDPDYPRAHSLHANMLAVHVGFGWSSNATEDGREARYLARNAIDRAPNDPTVLKHWALVGGLLEAPERALAPLERAIDLDPSDAHAWANLGWMLAVAGMGARGRAAIQRALHLAPEDPRVSAWHLLLANAYAADEQWRDAHRHVVRSLDLFPSSSPAWMLRAAAEAILQEPDRGRSSVERLLAVDRDMSLERATEVASRTILPQRAFRSSFRAQLQAAGLH